MRSLQATKTFRIPKDDAQEQAGLHYLVSDSTGKCASIEFLKGKMVCHTGWTMPVKVLVGANSTYDHSTCLFSAAAIKKLLFTDPYSRGVLDLLWTDLH